MSTTTLQISNRYDASFIKTQGEKHDAALDAIAAERPNHHGAQDEALDQRAQAQASDPGRRPAVQQPAAADGVRKQPDGVVVP